MNSLQEKSNAFISGFMLANFLQLINLEQKTCTLKVKSKNKVGYFYRSTEFDTGHGCKRRTESNGRRGWGFAVVLEGSIYL